MRKILYLCSVVFENKSTMREKKHISVDDMVHRLARWCSKAEHCTFDVRQKLAAVNMPESDKEEVIRILVREKFINDERFCKAFVNDRSKYYHWGMWKLRYALQKKEIPEQMIDAAIDAIPKEDNIKRLSITLFRKRKIIKDKEKAEIHLRLTKFAESKGFTRDEIEQALKIMEDSL
ncbi:MAG: RecX family transcriptional regulator [Dysgonamonadaceae bacterium]|jgi:regulatory protein|nr:RecX family transcriptional regulator [Dysgonamonadaceae bacterium]